MIKKDGCMLMKCNNLLKNGLNNNQSDGVMRTNCLALFQVLTQEVGSKMAMEERC